VETIPIPVFPDGSLDDEYTSTKRASSLPSVSLLVINHNGRAKLRGLLDECLVSLLKTSYPSFEILFVDNCSSDDSIEHVKQTFQGSGIRILPLSANLGYAGAVNLAISSARGSVIGVLNNDITVVDPRWLTTLVEFIQQRPSVGIVSPALLHDEKRIDSMGGDANVLMVAWDANSREEFFTNDEKPIYRVSPPGAAFVFRRDLATKLNNEIFDPDFFAYYEDVLLGFRVNMMGQKVAVLPNSILRHKRGGSWGLISPSKFRLQRRNAVWTGITIFDTAQVLLMLPWWLLSNVYAGVVYYRTTRNPRYLLSPFEVIWSVVRDMPKVWRKHLRFHRENGSSASALDFSSALIMDNEKLTFARRAALSVINVAIRLAGLNKFRITRLKRYPLLDPAYLAKNQ
jgi:GT2 family glycosyltransferase